MICDLDPILPTEARQVMDGLVSLAQRHGPPACFKGWPASIVEAYLLFHAGKGQLIWVRQRGRVAAVAVGWPALEADLRRPEFLDRPFNWDPPVSQPNAFYLGECVVDRGLDRVTRRVAIASLIADWRLRFPEWRTWKCFAIRRGRLVQFNPLKFFRRLALED
jgi:hypothetical protein